MSFRKFKFVSPGVFVNEIDNTQRPAVPEDVGPVVIGRFRRGPAFLPTRVESLSEFIRIFYYNNISIRKIYAYFDDSSWN